jgi:hypothetical protein
VHIKLGAICEMVSNILDMDTITASAIPAVQSAFFIYSSGETSQ